MMLLADDWKDYELIDTGDGEKLERWGKYILRRPDPQIYGLSAMKRAFGTKRMPIITGVKAEAADGNLKRSFRKGGKYPIMICRFILSLQALNIRAFFRNRRSTGSG